MVLTQSQLVAVDFICRYAVAALGERYLAVEKLQDYCADLTGGVSSPLRLLDFLGGLYASGALCFEDDIYLTQRLAEAFPGEI